MADFGYFFSLCTLVWKDLETDDWEPPGGWETWFRVRLDAMNSKEIVSILSARFTSVSQCVERVVICMNEVSKWLTKSRMQPRQSTLREAVKVCKRLAATKRRKENQRLPIFQMERLPA